MYFFCCNSTGADLCLLKRFRSDNVDTEFFYCFAKTAQFCFFHRNCLFACRNLCFFEQYINQLAVEQSDKRFRRWVLSSLIGHTYHHNFVTHLREAWYQREAMNIIEQGGAVNAETLSGIFRRNLETFWGDAVELTEGCELTWMRQPHYYMGLYSYTYSAGLTLATQAALNIAAEGESAVARWRAMLEAGSTHGPLGLAKIAGIDLSTPDALEHTIAYISDVIDEIAVLTEEIDGITLD